MNRAWKLAGRLAFWLGWPLLWLYLHNSRRTRVIAVHQGKIVVVKSWLGDGQWMLPGGGRHPGEPANKAASRELREETGLDVSAASLRPLGNFASLQCGFRYTYELFAVDLASEPRLRPDNSEIIEAQLLAPARLGGGSPRSDLSQALERWLS